MLKRLQPHLFIWLLNRICRRCRTRSFMRFFFGDSEQIRIVVFIIVEQTRGWYWFCVDIGFWCAGSDFTSSPHDIQESLRWRMNTITNGGFFRAFLDDVSWREDVRVIVWIGIGKQIVDRRFWFRCWKRGWIKKKKKITSLLQHESFTKIIKLTNYINRWRYINTGRYNIVALVRFDWFLLPQVCRHLIIKKILLVVEQIIWTIVKYIFFLLRCK